MNEQKIENNEFVKLNLNQNKLRATYNPSSQKKTQFFQLNRFFSNAVGKRFQQKENKQNKDLKCSLKRMSLKKDNIQKFLSKDFTFFDKKCFKNNSLYQTRLKNNKDFKQTYIQIQKQKLKNQFKNINQQLEFNNNQKISIKFQIQVLTNDGYKFCKFQQKFKKFYKQFYKINLENETLLKDLQYLKNFLKNIEENVLELDIRDDIDLQVIFKKAQLKRYFIQINEKKTKVIHEDNEVQLLKQLLLQYLKNKIIQQQYNTLDSIEQEVFQDKTEKSDQKKEKNILKLPEYLRTDNIRKKIEERNITLRGFDTKSNNNIKNNDKKYFNLKQNQGDFLEFKNQLHFPVIKSVNNKETDQNIEKQYSFKNLNDKNIDMRLQFCSKLLNSANFQNYTFKKFVCVLDAVELQKFNFDDKNQKESQKIKKDFKRIENIIDNDYLKHQPQESVKQKIEFLQEYIDKNSIQLSKNSILIFFFQIIIMQTSFLSRLSENFNGKSFYNNKSNTGSNQSNKTFHFWKGNNVFYLGGKLMSGPEDEQFFQNVFLFFLFIMTVVYYVAILPHIQASHQKFYGILYLFTFGMFLIFYLLTSFTEPGYMPHQNILRIPSLINAHSQQDKQIIVTASQNRNYPFESKIIDASNNQEEEIEQQVENVERQDEEGQVSQIFSDDTLPFESTNFCVYCKIYKPQRTHHCRTCNACVRVFDHHCTLANNCIGKRNYQFFILMNLFGFLSNMIFVIGAASLYHVQIIKGNFAFALFLWILISHSILIIGFCLFQVTLFLFFQQTTKEFIQDLTYEVKREYADWFFLSDCLIKYKEELTEENKKILLRQFKFQQILFLIHVFQILIYY